MRGPHNIWRLVRTGATFARTGALGEISKMLDLPKSVRIMTYMVLWPLQPLGYKGDLQNPPILRAIVALGPAYIKFGQMLSTRPDIVGVALARELSVLQDNLPPFSQEKAVSIVETTLGAPLSQSFHEFGEPVAAASLAQVHKARLHDGRLVAVKVLRPNIAAQFQRDIDAFHFVARFLEICLPRVRRLRPVSVVRHFEDVVHFELDLRLEAAVGSEYRENTNKDQFFRTPEIIWPYSTRQILTTSWLDGESLTNPHAIDRLGLDRTKLATHLMQSFLTQALRDGLFHADMHQGNIKITYDGTIEVLDFGIMGRLDSITRRTYAEILYGFLQRDYHALSQLHFDVGYVPKDQDPEAFALALRTIGEPIFGQGAANISMANLFGRLFEITEIFGMQTRTELILLQRTMVVVEGVARSIDPTLNIWEAARPVIERYIRQNVGPKAKIQDALETISQMRKLVRTLPKALERLEEPQEKPVSYIKPVFAGFVGFLIGGGLVYLMWI